MRSSYADGSQPDTMRYHRSAEENENCFRKLFLAKQSPQRDMAARKLVLPDKKPEVPRKWTARQRDPSPATGQECQFSVRER